jgi:hypothetical protein
MVANPKARDLVAKIMSKSTPQSLPFTPSSQALALDLELREQGYSLDVPAMDSNALAELLQYFKNLPCRDTYRPQLGTFPYDKPASEETSTGYYTLEEMLEAPHVLELLNDPLILETAEQYLGCKPLLDNLGVWWSYAGRPVPKGAQRFHRDLDSYRGFKQFLYLTDVDLESGPHHFIKGSHTSPKLNAGRAHCDEEIIAAFGQQNDVTITGSAGTRFIADTYGFHKGCLPTQSPRLILTAQYTVNRTPHLPKQPLKLKRKKPEQIDAYVNSLLLV